MAKYYRKNIHSERQATWQQLAKSAAFIFVLLVLVVPLLMGGNVFLRAIAGMIRNLGLVVSLGIGFFAFLKFLSSKAPSMGQPASRSSGDWRPPPPPSHMSSGAIETEWNRVREPILSEPEKPTSWSIETLRSIEWKRFEELTAGYFRAKGLRAETQTCGPDGGIDVWLYAPSTKIPMGIVQCKAWNSRLVGVKPIREFLGVMAHEKIERGFFMASGDFSFDAQAFAESHKITLITGERFLSMLLLQPPEVQQSLLAIAIEGDYKTPSCPSCGMKMVKRDSKRGAFWGCINYPRCKSKFLIGGNHQA